MPLREGDTSENIDGRIIFVIGRSGSGKSTLIESVRLRHPAVISLDDHFRVRAGIIGADRAAYDCMIGASWSLARQGHDVMCPCGGQNRELRDYIRSQIPSVFFVYIAERGRYYRDFAEPEVDEKIIVLDGGLDIETEVKILEEKIWKIITKN